MTIDFTVWDEEIESYDTTNKQRLYAEMKSELSNGENSEVLWRLTKACLILSIGAERLENPILEKEFANEALDYGNRSCALDNNNMNCHKWLCAALGRNSKYASAKEKVKLGQQFKSHADIAISLDPNDYLMHFMFGRFCYEVSSLSWFERKIANALFGSVPKTNFNEALQEFLTTDRLKPRWKDNYLWVSKTLIALKNLKGAKVWVKSGLELRINCMLDEIAHKKLINIQTQHKL